MARARARETKRATAIATRASSSVESTLVRGQATQGATGKGSEGEGKQEARTNARSRGKGQGRTEGKFLRPRHFRGARFLLWQVLAWRLGHHFGQSRIGHGAASQRATSVAERRRPSKSGREQSTGLPVRMKSKRETGILIVDKKEEK